MLNADQRFDSAEEAFSILSDRYSLRVQTLCLERPSGLTIVHDTPEYLFRGEPGCFALTLANVRRRETFRLRDGRHLSDTDKEALKTIWPDILKRFYEHPYLLDTRASICLFQHYGMPTWYVDFTRRLDYAISFAAGVDSGEEWRTLLVLPVTHFSGEMMNVTQHGVALRARRQEAFLVVPDEPVANLKGPMARHHCKIRLYEFRVAPAERHYWQEKAETLLDPEGDATAGNVRAEVTRYIEENDVSHPIRDWLLERVGL